MKGTEASARSAPRGTREANEKRMRKMKPANATTGTGSSGRNTDGTLLGRLSGRRSFGVAATFLGVLTSITALGYLGGGHPLAGAVELHPECEAYDALVEQCFPGRAAKAGNRHRTVASKEVCLSRTNQLKAVCR